MWQNPERLQECYAAPEGKNSFQVPSSKYQEENGGQFQSIPFQFFYRFEGYEACKRNDPSFAFPSAGISHPKPENPFVKKVQGAPLQFKRQTHCMFNILKHKQYWERCQWVDLNNSLLGVLLQLRKKNLSSQICSKPFTTSWYETIWALCSLMCLPRPVAHWCTWRSRKRIDKFRLDSSWVNFGLSLNQPFSDSSYCTAVLAVKMAELILDKPDLKLDFIKFYTNSIVALSYVNDPNDAPPTS